MVYIKIADPIVMAAAVVLFIGIASAGTAHVSVRGFKLRPAEATIKKGGMITRMKSDRRMGCPKIIKVIDPCVKSGVYAA